MPDPVETPAVPDAPAVLTDAEITEQAVNAGLEAAAAIETPLAPVAEPDPDAPPADEPPAEETPPDEPPPAEEPPAEEPPAADEPPAPPAAPLTDEEQDAVDAKELGFKNQRASNEFKAMRKELRELRPLQERLADTVPAAERWEKVYSYCQTHEIDSDSFGQGMAMMAGTKSNDPAIMKKTIEGLEWEADRLRQKMGIAGGSYDPLKDPSNKDLADAVENGDMAPQWAHQQAQQRAELAHRTALEQQGQAKQRENQELRQASQSAMSELDALEQEYTAIDPRYREKADILVPILKPIFASLPPAQWAGAFKKAYTELRLPAAAPAPTPAASTVVPLRNQPLRPGAPPAVQTKTVQSENEAIERALEAAAAIDGVPYRGTA